MREVKLELDKAGQDDVLDILVRLHLTGTAAAAAGSAGGDDDGARQDEEAAGDDGKAAGEEKFEYQGTFGELANMMAAARLARDGSDGSDDEEAHQMQEKQHESGIQEQEEEEGEEEEMTPKATRAAKKQLLKALIAEDRKETAVAKSLLPPPTPTPPSTGGKRTSAKKAAAAPLGEKVRLQICALTSAGKPKPERKRLVVSRTTPVAEVAASVRGKVRGSSQKAQEISLFLVDSGERLEDLSSVPDDAVVCLSSEPPASSAAAAAAGPPPPLPAPAATAASTPAMAAAAAAAAAAKSTKPPPPPRPPPADFAGLGDADDEEAAAVAAFERVRAAYRQRAALRATDVLTPAQLAEESGRLAAELAAAAARLEELRRWRAELPAAALKAEILERVRESQVLVLSGSTGCGKTTQVPQFILDEQIAAGRGAACTIICTQPRRISAVGVAERVAAERGETVGATVGYRIRLETRVGPRTRLTFCTTGMLLRRLMVDPQLVGVTHVLVDEVHERSLESDFLLILMRPLLAARPELRLVLMSATLQAEKFCRYFGGCPRVEIPGRAFPVTIRHADDVYRATGRRTPAPTPAVTAKRHSNGSGGSSGGGRGRPNGQQVPPRPQPAPPPLPLPPADAAASDEEDDEDGGEDGDEESDVAAGGFGPLAGDEEESFLSPQVQEKPDYDLIVDLVQHIIDSERPSAARAGSGGGGSGSSSSGSRGGGKSGSGGRSGGNGGNSSGRGGRGGGSGGRDGSSGDGGSGNGGGSGGSGLPSEGGAILIFMPGAIEIDRTVRALRQRGAVAAATHVLPLHAAMPPGQQRAVFKPPPPGRRKVVVATNVAETSITIEDVTHVIDSGRVKEMRYDPTTGMSALLEVWTSRASSQQRAGRAGRVRAGICWQLFPEAFGASLPKHTLPEMVRTPLEELVLQVLVLELGHPAAFLSQAVDPPPASMLRAALRNLHDLGAIRIPTSTSTSTSTSPLEDPEFSGDARGGGGGGDDKGPLRGPALTALGYHLSHLSVDSRVGKLLVIACLFHALEPVLTIAAALSHKSPFIRPPAGPEQARADAARQRFAQHKSDHLAIVEAFNAWRNRRAAALSEAGSGGGSGGGGGGADMWEWCRDNYLSSSALEMMEQLREQFRQQLVDIGFVGTDDPAAGSGGGGGGGGGGGSGGRGPPTGVNRYANNTRLVECVLCAGLSPHFAWFRRPGSGNAAGERRGHFITRGDAEPAFLHPSSVNHRRFAEAWVLGPPVWVAYHGKMRTSRVYLLDATFATPFALLLFGGSVRHLRAPHGADSRGSSREVSVTVDNWLRFRTREATAVVFKHLRQEIGRLLLAKAERPEADVGSRSDELAAVILRLLAAEGRARFAS